MPLEEPKHLIESYVLSLKNSVTRITVYTKSVPSFLGNTDGTLNVLGATETNVFLICGVTTLLADTKQQGVVTLQHTLAEHHDLHVEPCCSHIAGKWHQWPPYIKRQRREIKLKVQHALPVLWALAGAIAYVCSRIILGL